MTGLRDDGRSGTARESGVGRCLYGGYKDDQQIGCVKAAGHGERGDAPHEVQPLNADGTPKAQWAAGDVFAHRRSNEVLVIDRPGDTYVMAGWFSIRDGSFSRWGSVSIVSLGSAFFPFIGPGAQEDAQTPHFWTGAEPLEWGPENIVHTSGRVFSHADCAAHDRALTDA